MQNKVMVPVILFLGIFLAGGCVPGGGQTSEAEVSSVNQTRQGVLSQGVGPGLYVLQVSPGVIVELHDGNVSLAEYVGQSVKVTGQFSGTTLYVDEVELLGVN